MNVKSFKIIKSYAPIRICDLGGWTDTWFAQTGCVLNFAITPSAQVEIKAYKNHSKKSKITICAENFGDEYEIGNCEGHHPHPLLEATIDLIGIPKNTDVKINFYSGAPPGCSTGTSAAITVALIGALAKLKKLQLTAYETVLLAHRVETEKLGQQSGIQDQIAAAYGGINFIEMFQYPYAAVSPVIINPIFGRELEERFVLIYLGKAHLSSDVHKSVITRLEDKKLGLKALEKLRKIAFKGKNALMSEDLVTFGQIMKENTKAQRNLHPDLISVKAEKVIAIAGKYNVLGWKINGAGGDGGSVTLLCNSDAAANRKMIKEIENCNEGFYSIPISLSYTGLTVREIQSS
jgi:D-glycero-alpha-D-manno-heptose-7-phosphate kinase